MKMNRLKLMADLNKVLPGITTGKTILEDADTAVFRKGHIYTYNSAISVDVKNSQDFDLEGVVKAQDFYECLTKLPNDDFEITQEDSVWVLKDGKIKVKIRLIPSKPELFKKFDSLNPTENWTAIDGADFNKALKICNMPKNNSKFSGIFCDGENLISTDSFTINRYNLGNSIQKFWISNSAVSELLKWTNFTDIQFNKMWIQFKSSDEAVFSVRSLDTESFPIDRISAIITSTIEKDASFESEFTPEFFEAVERAAVFSGENDGHSTVDLNITSTGTEISSARMSGEYDEVVDNITSENQDFRLTFDVELLQSCSGLFSKFKFIENSTAIFVVLTVDKAIKIFSSIV